MTWQNITQTVTNVGNVIRSVAGEFGNVARAVVTALVPVAAAIFVGEVLFGVNLLGVVDNSKVFLATVGVDVAKAGPWLAVLAIVYLARDRKQ